jgi:hypothetical protein
MQNATSIWKRLGRLWIYWTVVCTISGSIVYLVFVLLRGMVFRDLPASGGLAVILAGALGGILAGLMQSRILRLFVPIPPSWVWVTAGGWALGILLVVLFTRWFRELARDLPQPYALTAFLVGAGISGTLSGIGQWVLLRDKINKALWWLLASGVGWLVAWIGVAGLWLVLGGGAPFPVEPGEFGLAAILGGVAGWLVGVEQGIALVGLIAQEAWETRRENRQIMPF